MGGVLITMVLVVRLARGRAGTVLLLIGSLLRLRRVCLLDRLIKIFNRKKIKEIREMRMELGVKGRECVESVEKPSLSSLVTNENTLFNFYNRKAQIIFDNKGRNKFSTDL